MNKIKIMEDLKCELEFCGKTAKYELLLAENIHCEYCNYLKYPANKTKLTLCNLQCSHLYWWPTDSKYDKKNNIIEVNYCIEKDGCMKCGRNDFQDALFIGQKINCYLCQYCNKDSRYELYLSQDIVCPYCSGIKYKKNHELFLCSTQCEKMDWKVKEYLTKKRLKMTKLIYKLESDECKYCHKKSKCEGLFEGLRIDI